MPIVHNYFTMMKAVLNDKKACHKTTEVVGQVHGTDSDGILRILLETGASATIILKDAIRGVNGPVLKEQPTK